MKVIGQAHCWLVRKLGGRHKWGKAHFADVEFAKSQMKNGEDITALWVKECRRCGTPSPVKQRRKNGTGTEQG